MKRVAVTMALCALCATAHAGGIYVNSFAAAPGPEWSGARLPVSVTPSGRTYLGPFTADTVHLALSNLPPHAYVSVSFQLFLIGATWGGNNWPSVFSVTADGGATVMRTTFGAGGGSQSYPDSYPGGAHPPYTGAAEHNTLQWDGVTEPNPYNDRSGTNDWVYNISCAFVSGQSSTGIAFSGSAKLSLWGITKLTVYVWDGVPPAGSVFAEHIEKQAVYRPTTGEWFFRKTDGSAGRVQWGGQGDVPAAADYLGTGAPQIAVYRPASGEWFIRKGDGSLLRIVWGGPGDVPIPGDYLMTGRAQIAVFRPATGQWFIRRDDGSLLTSPWGTAGDQPIILKTPAGF